ncbi:hypothetical protein CSW50_12135 [Thermus scotoductus]|uniref:ParB-like N-terminal domain-containing protein n=1 Tax=Thermus scotoductus TaxID=37636 RepID=A0A430QX13_THESC|nr:ParB N-terminal domain-containing protein [Thermus scotoductus]RTG99680.1 hypothetical protein CSW50_12135 [Thermus scotoductus]RTI04494.1 hypothetical protein CSW30_13200 [Thermus scotoductus]
MRTERWPLERVRAQPRRAVRDVDALARSIAEVGLLQPLVVAEDGTLLAGYHRYLALRELGWQEAPVVVLDLDALRRELATLEENLVRHELTELERAEHLRRQKEIYELLYPWTRDGVRQNLALTKVESGDEDPADTMTAGYKGNEEEDLSPIDSTPPFARHVERVVGVRTLYVYEDPHAGISGAWWAHDVFHNVPVRAVYVGTQRAHADHMARIHYWQ